MAHTANRAPVTNVVHLQRYRVSVRVPPDAEIRPLQFRRQPRDSKASNNCNDKANNKSLPRP
jgi:hypothetical protein